MIACNQFALVPGCAEPIPQKRSQSQSIVDAANAIARVFGGSAKAGPSTDEIAKRTVLNTTGAMRFAVSTADVPTIVHHVPDAPAGRIFPSLGTTDGAAVGYAAPKPQIGPDATSKSQLSALAVVLSVVLLLSAAVGWFVRRRPGASAPKPPKNAAPDRPISEVRREHRQRTRFRQGGLFDVGGRLLAHCVICDRSKSGARVRVQQPLAAPEIVRLLDDVDKISVEAKVAWNRGNELGLSFRTAPVPVEKISTSASPALPKTFAEGSPSS